ncbi:hypothetical protein Ping_1559 [Psychromonas ingrahamii 37]|uniref:PEP-CTERM protein-sorting domain-containing protein n=1 Tax=Psychromonas ingrahamii (strain DSM 17664 / CCUG 51855 / 37) TaxID=357804 RepID=A1SV48_PSYIN|nr:PEP-CTERM sorting domain-containing protein [Psychromonas ingrahamii]ABM03363.1 hypothetical protein Ping_1559 [Psychromonas ingrahamii 37]
MSKLLQAAIITASILSAHAANAALINILEDQTNAYAQVTYYPGGSKDCDSCLVTNPGTTIETFSGPIFPGGVFSGYHLTGDRTAYISDGNMIDSTSYSSINYAGRGILPGYEFTVNAGWMGGLGYGSGMALAETTMNLKFLVTEGDSSIYLFAEAMGGSAMLSLYDETSGILVWDFFYRGSADSAEIPLYSNHIYDLTGSLDIYTPFSGDPEARFAFEFEDKLTLASVPAPSTVTIIMLGLMGLGFQRVRENA